VPTRRRLLTTAAGAIAVATPGCLDLLTGDDLEFEAAAGGVATPAHEETGYEHHETSDVVVERVFEAGGQRRTVVVTNRPPRAAAIPA